MKTLELIYYLHIARLHITIGNVILGIEYKDHTPNIYMAVECLPKRKYGELVNLMFKIQPTENFNYLNLIKELEAHKKIILQKAHAGKQKLLKPIFEKFGKIIDL